MVTTFYPPWHFGGDAVHVQSLARALVRAGHDVDVVCFTESYRAAGGRADAEAPARASVREADGVMVHRLEHPLGRWSALWMHQAGAPGPYRSRLAAILDPGFDVLHFHNVSLAGGPSVLESGRARLRVLTLHDFWFVCPTHALWKEGVRACERPDCTRCCLRSHRPPQLWRHGRARDRALAQVDVVLAPSDWSARTHRERGLAAPIDVLPLYSRLAADAGAPRPSPARPQFLYAGRITPSKGVRPLLALFARLPDYDLVVAGDGDERAALVADYGSLPNVRFAGKVDGADLRELYAGATATVMPSLAPESFGMVAVESMSQGTPVIALDAGGLGEVVRATGGGLVRADFAALEQAIRRVASDTTLRDALGRAGQAACRERYSERRYLDDYLSIVHARLDARALAIA
jgi:glycosyltransferase involved in cell wall biosynthesis